MMQNKVGRKKGCVPWNKGIPRTKKIKKILSIKLKGRVPWNKGKKGLQTSWIKGKVQSLKTKKKISKSRKMFYANGGVPWNKKEPTLCSKCGKELSRHYYKMCRDCYQKVLPDKMSRLLRGRRLSDITKSKISSAPKCRGKNHRSWKGGITPLMEKIRKSHSCKEWKRGVFKRDNYTCRKCNLRGGNKNAHHIKGFSKIIEENHIKTFEQSLDCQELWDVNNGITFCDKCHKFFHKIYGEKNNNEKQIKEFMNMLSTYKNLTRFE